MHRKSVIFSLLLSSVFLISILNAQDLNLSFESQQINPWYVIGSKPENYIIKSDDSEKFDGNRALFIQNNKPSKDFGGVMYMIPRNLRGDSIEVSAMIKLKDVSSASKLGFMLRMDPQIYFENYDSKNVNGTSDWKEYKIKAKLNPEKVSGIFLGLWLNGEGAIWADQVKIKVDGTDLNESMFIDYKKDYSNIVHSGVSDFKVSPEINDRLVTLGKIWGLLKYRHPELAKGKHEWDLELFKLINQIVAATNNLEIGNYYNHLLDSLGEVDVVKKRPNRQQIRQKGNYSWIEKLPYSQVLKDRLSNLRYASFTKNHYYGFNQGVGNVRIDNEYIYPQLQNPDIGFRLLSLFRYWNIVQYFSPYRDLTDTKWEEVLKDYVPRMVEANDQLKYETIVASMLAEIKDAHTKLWGNPKALSLAMGQRMIPVDFTFAEGKPVVTKLNISESTSIQIGDVLLKKNGKQIKEIQDSVFQLISSPNPAVIDREMTQVLRRSINQIDVLEIERNGKKLEIQVPTILISDFKTERDTIAIKYLEGGIAYLNHGNLTTAVLKENEQKLKAAKGILIDYRNYPKEFLVFVLTPHLLPDTTGFVKFSSTSFENLGDFEFTPILKVGQKNPDYYKGKVAILVNEQTQSSAEYHTMAYRTAPKAKVFGSQTAGADGNVSQFYLPGGLVSSISGIGVYYPDGTETQRIGIVPDVVVKPTLKGIREGRDEVMEKALEYLRDM